MACLCANGNISLEREEMNAARETGEYCCPGANERGWV